MSGLTFTLPGSTTSCLPIDDGDKTCSTFMEVGASIDFLDTVLQNRSCPCEVVEQAPVANVLGYKNWLFEAIRDVLTRRQFQVFELYVVYGYTQEKIAAILNLKHQAVVSIILGQCRRRLIKKFGHMLEPLLPRKEPTEDA